MNLTVVDFPAQIVLAPDDRVLVTRLDYLGDVILSLPLVDALHARWPQVEIDYLTRPPASDLLDGDPRFSRVYSLARDASVVESLRLMRALRRRRYRAVVDLFGNPRSMWITRATGAPVRIGRTRGWRRRMYTHAPRCDAGVRAATRVHLTTAAALGVAGVEPNRPRLFVDPRRRDLGKKLLSGIRGSEPVVGLHPGGKWSVKRWPTSNFAELSRLVETQLGGHVVLFTGPGEERHTAAVLEANHARGGRASALGVRPIVEVAAIISQLEALVACDGGVMHTSVAVGTPTVGVFGSADPDIWFPYDAYGPYRAAFLPMPCRPCHRHVCPLGTTACLATLDAKSVLEVLRDVLAGDDAGRQRHGDEGHSAGDCNG